MRRLLAKAFVTTATLSACGKTAPPPEIETRNPPMPTFEAPPAPKLRLRKRTSAAVVAQGDAKRPASARTLNPKDARGRIVFAQADDTCVVEIPRDGGLPRGVTAPEMEKVDCPASMDDPAWDHCEGQLVLDEAAGTCVCATDYGNPPPPPRPAACPAGAVEKKP